MAPFSYVPLIVDPSQPKFQTSVAHAYQVQVMNFQENPSNGSRGTVK